MFQRVFLSHPGSVGESYWQHLKFAGWFGGWLFLAAGAAFVHAVLPCCFERTASMIVARLNARTHNRGTPPTEQI